MLDEKKIKASDVARFLNAKLFGDDVEIKNIKPIHKLVPNSLSFAKKFNQKYVAYINENPSALIICATEYEGQIESSYIVSDRPRLDFLHVIKEFFSTKQAPGIHPTANIHPDAEIGENIYIGANSYIGPEVSVGNNTIIKHNVVIIGKTEIGNNCVIKSNAVIGEEGFGFEYNEYGVPDHFPHIGSIEIRDNVWIGAGSTVECATIDKTIIKSNVKIDDLVQIGHNTTIGASTLIMAGSIICGGAEIGRSCWIAPNTSVKEKVKVHDNAYVGLGSVVINDIPANTVAVGNPARELRKRNL